MIYRSHYPMPQEPQNFCLRVYIWKTGPNRFKGFLPSDWLWFALEDLESSLRTGSPVILGRARRKLKSLRLSTDFKVKRSDWIGLARATINSGTRSGKVFISSWCTWLGTESNVAAAMGLTLWCVGTCEPHHCLVQVDYSQTSLLKQSHIVLYILLLGM